MRDFSYFCWSDSIHYFPYYYTTHITFLNLYNEPLTSKFTFWEKLSNEILSTYLNTLPASLYAMISCSYEHINELKTTKKRQQDTFL